MRPAVHNRTSAGAKVSERNRRNRPISRFASHGDNRKAGAVAPDTAAPVSSESRDRPAAVSAACWFWSPQSATTSLFT